MPSVPPILFLSFTFLLFIISLIGIFINFQSLLRVIICLELTFLGCNLNFVVLSTLFHEGSGYVFSLVILSLTGCEVALGLSLCIVIFRYYSRQKLSEIPQLKT